MWICRKTRIGWPCPLDPYQGRERFCSSNCRKEFASSLNVATCARKMAFSFSRKLARIAISSSRDFRASRDFFAARLLRFRRSKYLSSLASSGMGFFSLRGRRCVCCVRAMECATADDEPTNIKTTKNVSLKTTYFRQKKLAKTVSWTIVSKLYIQNDKHTCHKFDNWNIDQKTMAT